MLEIRRTDGILHATWTLGPLRAEPVETLLQLGEDAEPPSDIRAVIFHVHSDPTASGPAPPRSPRELIRLHRHLDRAMTRIERLELPTASILHGEVNGIGLQLALVTDLRVATSATTVGIDLLSGGALPGAALARLPKYLGLGRARQMLLLGERISVEDAAAAGLVDVVSDDPEAAWPPLLERLLAMPPLTVSMVRRILKDSFMADMEEARATFRAALFQIASETSQ